MQPLLHFVTADWGESCHFFQDYSEQHLRTLEAESQHTIPIWDLKWWGSKCLFAGREKAEEKHKTGCVLSQADLFCSQRTGIFRFFHRADPNCLFSSLDPPAVSGVSPFPSSKKAPHKRPCLLISICLREGDEVIYWVKKSFIHLSWASFSLESQRSPHFHSGFWNKSARAWAALQRVPVLMLLWLILLWPTHCDVHNFFN